MARCQVVLRVAAMMAVCAAAAAPPAHAQDGLGGPIRGEVGVPRPETYGTLATTDYVLQAYAFEPFTGAGANFILNNLGSRGCTSTCTFEAPVMLPAGAVITRLELEACDTDAAGQLTARLYRQAQLETLMTPLVAVSTGLAAAPGCALFNIAFAPTHVVDNETGTYIAEVAIAGSTIATRFQAVRLVYRLQVSPAPATASFPNDVPTGNPFFRFVEALAAAGITGGCGAGSYCPDAAVTRGEMAVFLSTALGLHFPN